MNTCWFLMHLMQSSVYTHMQKRLYGSTGRSWINILFQIWFWLHIKTSLEMSRRMKFIFFPKDEVCCWAALQQRGTSWSCRKAIYSEGLKWAASGHQASTVLIASPPLVSSEFPLPTRWSPVQTPCLFSDAMEPHQLAVKLLFTVKSAAIWKKVHNLKI